MKTKKKFDAERGWFLVERRVINQLHHIEDIAVYALIMVHEYLGGISLEQIAQRLEMEEMYVEVAIRRLLDLDAIRYDL